MIIIFNIQRISILYPHYEYTTHNIGDRYHRQAYIINIHRAISIGQRHHKNEINIHVQNLHGEG